MRPRTLALRLLGLILTIIALSTAHAQTICYNNGSVVINEGTLVSGTAASLNGGSYVLRSQSETNAEVASFFTYFSIPSNSPGALVQFQSNVSAGTPAVGATGSFIQVWLYSPSAGSLLLGVVYPQSNGDIVESMPLSRAQFLQYRDSNGLLNVQLRAVRQSNAGTGTLTFTTSYLDIYAQNFPVGYTGESHGASITDIDAGKTHYLDFSAYDINSLPQSLLDYLGNVNSSWGFGTDFDTDLNYMGKRLVTDNFANQGGGGALFAMPGTTQPGNFNHPLYGQIVFQGRFWHYKNGPLYPGTRPMGKSLYVVVVRQDQQGSYHIEPSSSTPYSPSYYNLQTNGEDDACSDSDVCTNQQNPYEGPYGSTQFDYTKLMYLDEHFRIDQYQSVGTQHWYMMIGSWSLVNGHYGFTIYDSLLFTLDDYLTPYHPRPLAGTSNTDSVTRVIGSSPTQTYSMTYPTYDASNPDNYDPFSAVTMDSNYVWPAPFDDPVNDPNAGLPPAQDPNYVDPSMAPTPVWALHVAPTSTSMRWRRRSPIDSTFSIRTLTAARGLGT